MAPQSFIDRVDRNEHDGAVNDEWSYHRHVVHVHDPTPRQGEGLEDNGPVDGAEEVLPKVRSHERFTSPCFVGNLDDDYVVLPISFHNPCNNTTHLVHVSSQNALSIR